jgi:hypothetical protein
MTIKRVGTLYETSARPIYRNVPDRPSGGGGGDDGVAYFLGVVFWIVVICCMIGSCSK